VAHRVLEIDGLDQPGLDAQAIVLGPLPLADMSREAAQRSPAVLWQGNVAGSGRGPQRAYYVVVYDDSTGRCACPDFYFRGVLRRNLTFECKHLRLARAGLSV
jgi:hypothetical protein